MKRFKKYTVFLLLSILSGAFVFLGERYFWQLSDNVIRKAEKDWIVAFKAGDFTQARIIAETNEWRKEDNNGIKGIIINSLFPIQFLICIFFITTGFLIESQPDDNLLYEYDEACESVLQSTQKLSFQRLGNRVGFVYFIYCEPKRVFKIGKSVDPKKRFCAIKTASPNPKDYRLFGLIKSDDYHNLEKSFHLKYELKRRSGEWFDISIDEVKNEILLHNGELKIDTNGN